MLTLGIQSREEAQQPPREAMGRSSSQQPVPTSSQDESSDGPGTQSGHFRFSGYPSWCHVTQTVSEKPCSECRFVRKINVFSHLVWGGFFLCGAWIPLPKPVYPSSSYCECGLLRSCGHALSTQTCPGLAGVTGEVMSTTLQPMTDCHKRWSRCLKAALVLVQFTLRWSLWD